MSLTGTIFLFFFLPISLGIYHISHDRAKEYILLAISVLFYAFCSLKYAVTMVVLAAITVALGRSMASASKKYVRRILLVGGIVLNVSLLGYYKYTDFGISIYNDLLGKSVELQNLLLPLGISFFTFKAISYLVDIYKKKADMDPNLIHDAMYLLIFTQIQSGPLTRYNDMKLSQSERGELFRNGILRFVVGFNKKVLIANVLVKLTDDIFAMKMTEFSVPLAYIGSISYSIQLFFDFAGYSDMAIGLSEMFGYKCIENFNYPYMTESVAQFWRRWHISLGAWFRDYIYIPMGGSRTKTKAGVYFNLLTVWILTGIWHGASWNFVVWGLSYFVLIALERLLDLPGRFKSKVVKVIYRIFVVFLVNILWIVFRAETLTKAWNFIKCLFVCESGHNSGERAVFLLKEYWFFIAAGILLCFPLIPWLKKKTSKNPKLDKGFQIVYSIILIFLFLWALSFVAAGQSNPFAYANF